MNIYYILHKIKSFPEYLKDKRQRFKYGYSYVDTYSIYYWFSEVAPKILTDFRNNLHGCPASFVRNANGEEYQDVDKGVEDWGKVIDRMIFCFTEMNEDVCSMKNEFAEEYFKQIYPEGWQGKRGTADSVLEEQYYKREKEIVEYRDKMKDEGFKLFTEYFWNLWD